MKSFGTGLCMFLCGILLGGCIIHLGGRNAGHPPPPPKEDLSDANYRVRVGDTLSIRCLEDMKVDIQQTISQEGELDLAYVNRVKVTGKTIHEIKELLAKTYEDAGYFVKPHFNITVIAYKPRLIYISGMSSSGTRPVEFAPTEGITFAKAIRTAGGISPRGNPRSIMLTRDETQTVDGVQKTVRKQYHINYKRILYDNDDDFPLAENDLIHIEEDWF
ncbi:MAG: polysaccharide biosynthesis/export family protein [Puniceicoccales bacterium]|jgi:protein involved in polysaccharide export with SLBB domain|nr:polysaccharide biosynthesis/export family protein [Puniceicoccales bacterium]